MDTKLKGIVKQVVAETHGEHMISQIAQRVVREANIFHSSHSWSKDVATAEFEAECSPPPGSCITVMHDTFPLGALDRARKVLTVVFMFPDGTQDIVDMMSSVADYGNVEKGAIQLGNKIMVKAPKPFVGFEVMYLSKPKITVDKFDTWLVDEYPEYLVHKVVAVTMRQIGDDAWSIFEDKARSQLRDIRAEVSYV